MGQRLVEQAVDGGLGSDVDARRRFLQDQQAQSAPEPAADHDLLLVSAGQGGDGGLAVAGPDREPVDQGDRLGAFAAGSDPAWRWPVPGVGVGQEVLPYGQLGEAAFALSVAGYEGDTACDGVGDRTGVVRAAVQQHPSPEERSGPREGPAEVHVSGAREADQAEGFPGSQLQVDRSGAGGPYGVERQDRRAVGAGRGGAPAGRFLAGDVTDQTDGAVARRRAVADEAAVTQDGEGVGDLVHLVQAVADVEDAVAPVPQGVQDAEQSGAVGGGEPGGRFVEDDELRPCRQGPGDGDQGPLGGVEVGDRRVGVETAADDLQCLGAALPGAPPGDQAGAARVSGAQSDVLGDRHPLHETEVLVDEGHAAGGGVASEGVSVHRDPARVGVVDAGEDLDERGLSGSVGAEEREDAAGVDVEVDPGQCEGPAEPFGETADADQRFRPAGRGRLRRGVVSVVHGQLRGSA